MNDKQTLDLVTAWAKGQICNLSELIDEYAADGNIDLSQCNGDFIDNCCTLFETYMNQAIDKAASSIMQDLNFK